MLLQMKDYRTSTRMLLKVVNCVACVAAGVALVFYAFEVFSMLHLPLELNSSGFYYFYQRMSRYTGLLTTAGFALTVRLTVDQIIQARSARYYDARAREIERYFPVYLKDDDALSRAFSVKSFWIFEELSNTEYTFTSKAQLQRYFNKYWASIAGAIESQNVRYQLTAVYQNNQQPYSGAAFIHLHNLILDVDRCYPAWSKDLEDLYADATRDALKELILIDPNSQDDKLVFAEAMKRYSEHRNK